MRYDKKSDQPRQVHPRYASMCTFIDKIRANKPLVLNVTNAVTMDFVANGLLCLGASPVMSVAHEEFDELLQVASVLVINVGTLDERFLALAEKACTAAEALAKPIVLDPVGAGASRYRTEACRHLLDSYPITAVRGNAGEIGALIDAEAVAMRGVDAVQADELPIAWAERVATRWNTTVVMSGAVDVIADSTRTELVARGAAIMPCVTGTGCLLSAVVAAFTVVSSACFDAGVAASLFYAVSGERAAREASAPGSFKVQFLDALSAIPNAGDYDV